MLTIHQQIPGNVAVVRTGVLISLSASARRREDDDWKLACSLQTAEIVYDAGNLIELKD